MGYYREDEEWDMNKLIGFKVKEIELSDDSESLTLYGEHQNGKYGHYSINTEGECCSQSWIESIFEPNALIGYEILKIDHIELPDSYYESIPGTTHYEDYVQYYGFAMYTSNGKCVIDYRNSSNGYYGGSIWLSKFVTD